METTGITGVMYGVIYRVIKVLTFSIMEESMVPLLG